jgi:dTMP kinase
MTQFMLAGQFWPYFWTYRVYRVCIEEQGAGRDFTPETIRKVIELVTEGLKPDLTLLFDLPVAECLARTQRRTEGENKADRLDIEDAAFHTRVRDAYLQFAANEPERIRIIDATGSINETHQRVLEVVIPFLEKRNPGFRIQNSE